MPFLMQFVSPARLPVPATENQVEEANPEESPGGHMIAPLPEIEQDSGDLCGFKMIAEKTVKFMSSTSMQKSYTEMSVELLLNVSFMTAFTC
jgi:hypothetical protein